MIRGSKLYITLLIIIPLIAFSCLKNNTNKERIYLCSEEKNICERTYIKRKARKKIKDINFIWLVWRGYFASLRCHFFRTGLISWLMVCLFGLKILPFAAVSIFSLSSIGTLLRITASYFKWENFSKKIGIFNKYFHLIFKVTVAVLLCLIALFALGEYLSHTTKRELFDVVQSTNTPQTALPALAAGVVLSRKYISKYAHQDIEIKENKYNYRIKIGNLRWQICKENHFDLLIFAMLIYSAKKTHDENKVSMETLTEALDLSMCKFRRLFTQCQNRNNSLIGILFEKAYAPLVRDLQEEDIGQGLTQDQKEKLKVQIEKKQDHYLVELNEIYWKIPLSNRFEISALEDVLLKACDKNAKRITNVNLLAKMQARDPAALNHQINKYKSISQHYQELKFPGKNYDKKLSQKIINMWLEDITLSAEKIAQKLMEQGHCKITASKVYQLVSQVYFSKIRRKIFKDYKQEKYNKNTKWIFAKYQQVIDQLLKKLETKQALCSKGKQKIIDDLPATVPTDKLQENLPPRPYSAIGWLKCFLFNLPKSKNGKICCPTCGGFETAKKSKIPLPQIANDPKTGKTITVDTFRFYCKNAHCSVNSFSTAADGSHILGEARYAKFATMLRLVFSLNGSYRATANLLGIGKSNVFDSLSLLSKTIYCWEDILGISRFTGTLCIDEKFVKIAQFKKSKGNRPFAYLFFAVDANTYDLFYPNLNKIQTFFKDA